jgi:hypothetical protein
MKKIYLFIFPILLFAGCKSEFQSFNEQALNFANSDSQIDESEYAALVKEISDSNEKGFLQFKDDSGQINHQKVVSYLVKYFRAKSLTLTEKDIWQRETVASAEDTFNINVFVENSASMDGYVNGVTEFETAVYNLLGDFKINAICDSLNLNYINKSIPYSKKNVTSAEIQDFIEKLEPSTFRQRGGDRSVSDLKNVLSTVLKTVNDKNAAVLVSDFVFSPGRNEDAKDYLNNQSIGIKIDFAEKLKEFDLSAVVIQLESNFDGTYFDKTDTQVSLPKVKRPYYIWVIGSTSQISQILNNKILDNIKGGYLNRFVLQSIRNVNEPKFKVLYRPRIGEFDSKSLAQNIISDASPSRDSRNEGVFGFNVAIDFSNSLQDEGYYLDATNYTLSNDNYQLSVKVVKDNNDASLTGFTHVLNLQTKELREEVIKIDIVGKTPSWVSRSTSIDDSNILNDKSEQNKTFGLKFLIEGVSDAFYPKSNSNALSTLSITIKK